MSPNFLFDNINIINKKNLKINVYKNISKKASENKKDTNKLKKNNLNIISNSINQKNLINLTSLKNSYKNSLILLDMIQKQTEKNILKKYNVKYFLPSEEKKQNIINNNNKLIENIILKKKFLITPFQTSFLVQ